VLDVDERPGSSQHRGSVARLFRPFELWLLRQLGPEADLVVVVCENHRELVQQSLPATTPTAVVRNVPETRVRSSFVQPSPVKPGQPVVFTSVGSIFEGRAFEVLVQACGLLARAGARVQVRVVGHGHPEYLARLRELARAEGADGVLEFTGRVAPDEVAGAYAVAHVGLALYEPSLRHNDSLPNKVLEAVSCGRPVLATGQPDTAAFLTTTHTGWTVDYSAAALAAEMTRLATAVADGTLDLDALCRQCRALGDDELTWEREFVPVLGPVVAGTSRSEPGVELSALP
jgi:glycosyltransferase involved in cell wall biosynthesis